MADTSPINKMKGKKMDSNQELDDLKQAFARMTAKQMATECMISTLIAFIELPPLLAEVVLQKAADAEADAMQQDGSADALLPAFLEEIGGWQSKLSAAENMHGLRRSPGATDAQA